MLGPNWAARALEGLTQFRASSRLRLWAAHGRSGLGQGNQEAKQAAFKAKGLGKQIGFLRFHFISNDSYDFQKALEYQDFFVYGADCRSISSLNNNTKKDDYCPAFSENFQPMWRRHI